MKPSIISQESQLQYRCNRKEITQLTQQLSYDGASSGRPRFILHKVLCMVWKRMSRNLFEKAHTVVRLNVKRTTWKLPSFRSSKKITPSSFSRVSTALICVIGQEEAAQWGEVVLYRAVQKDVGEQKKSSTYLTQIITAFIISRVDRTKNRTWNQSSN